MESIETPSPTIPRYRQLTATLRDAIAAGEYPVGSLLPTEIEISRRFGVSRHTVRDALRILNSAGLIQRRRRVGTIVMAQSVTKEFVQPLPGFNEILQYSRDIRLVIESYDGPFDCPLADEFGLDAATWIRIDGRRGPEERLIGLTTIIIRRDRVPPQSLMEKLDTSLGELIETNTDVVVARIDQEISATTVERGAARILKVNTGAPALRARRLYYDAAGELFLLTESIHPADRFSYRLSFARGAPDEL